MKTAFLSLLSLCFIELSTSTRPPFQPVSKFDVNKLLGVNWYEPFYADADIGPLFACVREVYTSIGGGKITLQIGEYVPGINGDYDSALLTLQQQGNSGTFKILTASGPIGYYYVLDYGKDCEWVIYAVDITGDENKVIVLITKDPENLYALKRILDLAEKYELGSHHLQLETPKCNYNKILWNLKQERNQ